MTRTNWIVTVAVAAIAGAGVGAVATHAALAAEDSNLPWQTDVAGGAPSKVLVDNDALRVTLISYPEGFHRQGDQRRPYDTLIAYVDEGSFKVSPRPGARPRTGAAPNASRLGKPAQCDPNPAKDCGAVGPDGTYSGQPYAPGTVNYHPKGNVTPTITVTKGYRALYIELKK